MVKIIIGDDLEKFFQIGSQLPHHEREDLIKFFRRNIDVFAWNAYEAPGVDPEFICHHLKVNSLIPPRKQPPRRPFKEHAEAVREEVTKLKQARAIKEVFYPERLVNTVAINVELSFRNSDLNSNSPPQINISPIFTCVFMFGHIENLS